MGDNGVSRWRVLEVHNFGGFFGGDTVTLTAARHEDGVEETITIDERALSNVRERHSVAPDMVFDLLMVGERVDRADLLGAAEWSILHAAIDMEPSSGTLDAPCIRAYRCGSCDLWIVGAPDMDQQSARCRLCGEALA
jgi:pimeloyl-ACP methyl ester carboxylesterase